MRSLFSPKSIAVVGASRDPHKVGHVIFKNLLESFSGEVFPVNPNATDILGKPCYPNLRSLPEVPELVIISIPAKFVPSIVKEASKIGVKYAIIISGGFGEIGRQDLDKAVLEAKGDLRIVGPNCLGIYDSESGVDTLFLPEYRLKRPRKGGISLISQSGAVGSSILDWAGEEGFGVSKFISYGNALDLKETDFLEYLGKDRNTRVICMYIEGISDGKRFFEVAIQVSKRKPIVVMKVGRTESGSKAAKSHTGAIAGDDVIYNGVFRQAGIIRVYDMVTMFDIARTLSEQPLPKGPNVGIVTNGGGYGVISADEVSEVGLSLPELSLEAKKELRKRLPSHAIISNPLDLVGDADVDRYKTALEVMEREENIHMVMCNVLFQTAGVQSEIIDVIREFSDRKKKPIVVVSAGGDYTRFHMRMLERSGVPTFDSPRRAALALKALYDYSQVHSPEKSEHGS